MTNERKEKQVSIMGIISLAVLCLALSVQESAQDKGTAREAFKGSVELRDRMASIATSVDGYASELEKVDRSFCEISRSHGSLDKHSRPFSKDLARSTQRMSRLSRSALSTLMSAGDYTQS